ncbi:MAG TPA: endonuclease/exonuclease/phosphatase family protein [Polyangiaceae bacterium]|nr:endonuclease/exonuclease/phosphatase family protein [Polyangiaceae bacterium]
MRRAILRARVLTSAASWALLRCGPGAPATWCPAPSAEISEVQGNTAASPLLGQRVELNGVVSAAPARVGSRRGFFLQAQEARSGIFIADGGPLPAPGDRVHVAGTVAELGGVTALAGLELLQPCGRARLEPGEHELGSAADTEGWQGSWLRSRQTWTLLDTTELWSRGRVRVSAQGRAYAAGHPLGAQTELWTLEGMSASVSPGRDDHFERLRLGAQTSELTAVLLSTSPPTLLATEPVEFRAPPPASLAPRAGALRIAALNLDNYFLDPGERGAASPRELARQRAKLVAALSQLDADILALNELENQPPGASDSAADLLTALNAQLPPELSYALSTASSAPEGALRSAIAYRPRRVQASGTAWFASAPGLTRAPLLQTFVAAGRSLTVAALHLKSKVCDGGAQIVGPEGCGAETRRGEARALGALVAQLRAEAHELLLIGDFNSDSREAPLLELQRAGLSDLFASVAPWDRYSYVFDGRATQLDQALATPALAAALVRAQIWHIDADEPEWLDYHLDNPPGSYRPDARRCSDHDPILVDLEP